MNYLYNSTNSIFNPKNRKGILQGSRPLPKRSSKWILMNLRQGRRFLRVTLIYIFNKGGFSMVHKGNCRGLEVAIKKIFNPNITQEVMEELNNEVNMLATLRHPNIVLLVGIVSKPPNLCIITEYLQKGDLFNLLHK